MAETSNDIVVAHVCYGGEGGQLAAAQTLSRELRSVGLRSGAVALGQAEALVRDPRAWADMDQVCFVPLRRRGDVASMLATAREVRALRPRVILCHSHRHAPAAFVGQLLSGRIPRMLVIEHHSIPLRSRMDNFRSAIALALSRGVVLLSREYQQSYPLRQAWLPGARKQFVVPNGIDLAAFQPRRSFASEIVQAKRIVIGMASRLVPSKEHDVLLRALAQLRVGVDRIDVELRVAGDGPTADRLVNLSIELGIHDRVTFLGHVEGDDLRTFFSGLDLYAHATLGEGLSIALLEAAACSLPIVASDVVGVRDVFVDGQTAILVAPSDPQAMAGGIRRAAHPTVGPAFGRRAREMVEESYSSTRVREGYREAMNAIDPLGPWLGACGPH